MKKKHFYTAVILLLLLTIGIQPTLATIYITAEGWKDETGQDPGVGTWDEPTKTATLTTDVYETIQIDIWGTISQHIILDGSGYTVDLGGSLDAGVQLNVIKYVDIQNLHITNCGEGISLIQSGTINVINNTISGCQYGIWMALAGTCTIEGNIISGNTLGTGIWITTGCVNNFLCNNTIEDNNWGIYITGTPTPEPPEDYHNWIYNNNFINSGLNAKVQDSALGADVFYDNYWDDWSGSGPYVIETDPYLIQDNSPLMDPLPLTPEVMIQLLIIDVEKLNAKEGIINSLDAKLQNALDALDAANAGQRQDALNKMEAFINAVLAQSGNQISEDDAALLIAQAEAIIAQL